MGEQFLRESYLKQNNINFNGKSGAPIENEIDLNANAQNLTADISFRGIECSTQNFPMKKVYELECPCCGQTMLTKKQVDAFVLRTRDKTGEELVSELEKGLPYYRSTERTIVREISETAKCFPEAGLHELVCLQAVNSKSGLEAAQKAILNEMRTEAQKLPEEQRKQVELAVTEAEHAIDFSDDEQHFQRRAFIQSIEDICDKYEKHDSKRLRRLCRHAAEIPSSQTSKDAFYIKYKRRDNEAIARRLVMPAIITTEHVQAHSEGGENNTANYIPMCGDCNSRRGNMPYDRWFVIHPEMPSNLQKYINTVSQMIETGALDDEEYLNTYVDEVIDAVSKATYGKLKLKKPELKSSDFNPETDSLRQRLTIVKNKIDVCTRKIQTLARTKARLEKDDEYQKIYGAIQAGGEEALAAFREPQTIQAEINEKSKIQKRQETLSKKINALREEITPREELSAQMAKLNNKIADLKMQMEDLETDFTPGSAEAQSEIKKYEALKLKLDMLSKADIKNFREAFPKDYRKKIDPVFILQDEKLRLTGEIDEYSDLPSVRHYLLSQELEKEEGRREELHKRQVQNNGKIDELEAALKEAESFGGGERSIYAEIRALKARKSSVLYRIKNINIDNDIAELQKEIERLEQERADIENLLNPPANA